MKPNKILLFAACLGLICLAAAAAPAAYHLLHKISLGAAPGGGEYFDYITVDSTPLGTISGGLKRDHGVALVPDLGRGFITDGETGQVTMFDLKTLKSTGQIKAEKDADFILLGHRSARRRSRTGGCGRARDDLRQPRRHR
jgi:hypothetical protein